MLQIISVNIYQCTSFHTGTYHLKIIRTVLHAYIERKFDIVHEIASGVFVSIKEVLVIII